MFYWFSYFCKSYIRLFNTCFAWWVLLMRHARVCIVLYICKCVCLVMSYRKHGAADDVEDADTRPNTHHWHQNGSQRWRLHCYLVKQCRIRSDETIHFQIVSQLSSLTLFMNRNMSTSVLKLQKRLRNSLRKRSLMFYKLFTRKRRRWDRWNESTWNYRG